MEDRAVLTKSVPILFLEWRGFTRMVKVARSQPFTFGFPGLGGLGLILLRSIAVAIVLDIFIPTLLI
jgi:hypothetical protein